MKLPESLTTVTPLSKITAMLVFILLPFATFFLGIRYQKNTANYPNTTVPAPMETEPTEGVFCTADDMMCPDGSYVGRAGPECEFEECPGGIMPAGEHLTGYINDITYDCHFDGICSAIISGESKEGEVTLILLKGEEPEPEPRGIYSYVELDESRKEEFIGKFVEVFAHRIDENTMTLYGNEEFYLKQAAKL